jgi:CheY-like chemotaxis protein
MINLHLLLVDDESDIRQTVETSLALDPFFILRDCASGAETLAAAVAWRPDFILLDVKMPDMDGPTVLRRLRADRRTAPRSRASSSRRAPRGANISVLGRWVPPA